MKDYFNSSERDEFLTFLKSLDHGEKILREWGNRSNLTNEEKKDLSLVLEHGYNFLKSVTERQNEISKKSISKSIETSAIMLDYRKDLEKLLKKRCSDIDAAYEENKDYFALVELILHFNCRNCSSHGAECPIYKEFEKNRVPHFDGWEKINNCKYSYKMMEEETNE